jgi:hypothetical protein
MYEAALAKVKAKIGHYRPSIAADPSTTMGSIISKAQHEHILGFIESAKQEGARLRAHGRTDGVPDPNWALRVIKCLEEHQIDKLIAEATPHQLLKAGNVGGELLNWIAMLGARQPQTELCRSANAEWPRLRRVALELNYRYPSATIASGRLTVRRGAQLPFSSTGAIIAKEQWAENGLFWL